MEERALGEDIFKNLHFICAGFQIEVLKLAFLTTDGAPAMIGL